MRKNIPGFDVKPILADKVNSSVGSGPFILTQSIVLLSYVIFQLTAPTTYRFDPYPFILLNLLLSFQAAYTGPFVLWSQNRSGKRLELVLTYIRDVVTATDSILKSTVKTEKKIDKELSELRTQLDEIKTLLETRRGE